MRQSGSWRVASLVVFGVVALDQLSKQWILSNVTEDERIHVLGPLSLVRRFNTGGAFSLAQGQGVFPWVVSALVASLLVWFIRGIAGNDLRLRGTSLVAISAMVGGALGNQVDRLIRSPGWNRGAVVDFLATGFWPVFNIADTALFCGAVTIAVLALRSPKGTPVKAPRASQPNSPQSGGSPRSADVPRVPEMPEVPEKPEMQRESGTNDE
jgi:signal peptidase II